MPGTDIYGEMTIFDLLETLEGLNKVDRARVAGEWLVEASKHVKRTFAYGQAFPKTEVGCVSKFARTLDHKDWTDGQDLVQAEESATEEGFNLRFHRIEDDLDALGTDVKMVFGCVAAMRSNLADRLEEIRLELNRINADLAECCTDEPQLVQTANIGDIYAGGKVVGFTNYFGHQVMVVNTSGGLVIVPRPGPTPDPARIRNVRNMASVLYSDARINKVLSGGEITKKQFVERFGRVQLSDDVTLEDVLSILPDETTFTGAQELIKLVAERNAAAIRSGGASGEVIATTLGLEDVEHTATAEISRFETVPAGLRTSLAEVGIRTVGDLAGQDPTALAGQLTKAGVKVGEAEAAGWVAAAQTVGALG